MFKSSTYPQSARHRKFLCFLLLLSIPWLFISSCSKAPGTISKTGFYFDTVITITLYDCGDEAILDGCMELAAYYEDLFSATRKNSDISRINDAPGTPVTVDSETIALLEQGLYYCELSGGAFDITIGKLSELWHFSDNTGNIPAQTDIDAAIADIDYHSVLIDGDQVTLTDPNAAIDLGGIAKGYIADRMKEYLTAQGVTAGIINLGGNVLTLGEKSDHTPYTIGIQKPFAEGSEAYATIQVTDKSVVSSGVYERCFYVDDVLYHHILDTTTGYPIDNDLISVSIISRCSVDGDGLSTVCFSLGLEEGMRLIEELPDTEAIFVTEDMEAHTTSGIGTDIPFELRQK